MIGIASAIVPQAQNIGFAINVATAGHVFEDLVEFGKAHHPYLGVDLADYVSVGLGMSPSQIIGTAVTRVDAGSPANSANLQLNDVIIKFEQEEITSTAEFIRILWRYHSGDRINLTAQRNGITINIVITLGESPDNTDFI